MGLMRLSVQIFSRSAEQSSRLFRGLPLQRVISILTRLIFADGLNASVRSIDVILGVVAAGVGRGALVFGTGIGTDTDVLADDLF